MNPDNPSDPALLKALIEGDEAALDAVMERWERTLFAFAWRFTRNTADAQDLVAETFVRLYRSRERLTPTSNLRAWLYTTLANLCRNQHRWRRRHPALSLEALESQGGEPAEPPAREVGAPEGLERAENRDAVRAAIAALPDDLRLAVMLHYFEQLSFREIGEITGCSERGVETRLYRARRRLRQVLGGAAVAARRGREGLEAPAGGPGDAAGEG